LAPNLGSSGYSRNLNIPIATTSKIVNELWLEIFARLPVTALIQSYGVCKTWKCLVPLADIHPARRALVKLYYFYIRQPEFILSRPATIAQLRPFNRQAYLAYLLSHNTALSPETQVEIPDEFYFYILEWPSRAVFFRFWPGFVTGFRRSSTINGMRGFNSMSLEPAPLYIVTSAESNWINTPTPGLDDHDPRADPAWLPRNDSSQPRIIAVDDGGMQLEDFPALLLKEDGTTDLLLVLRRSTAGQQPGAPDIGQLVVDVNDDGLVYHNNGRSWCSFQIAYLKRLRIELRGEITPLEDSPEKTAYYQKGYDNATARLVRERKGHWRSLQPAE
ncbi:hypothetical protein C8J56DRAFT_395154, partial [Mycena floridula]